MGVIYLSANGKNLGEVMDLSVIRSHCGEGEVFWLDKAVKDSRYRSKVISWIRGRVPIVAGGGSMSKYFSPFWESIPRGQEVLFVGTGVCCPHGTREAIVPNVSIHSSSRFRGPIAPSGFSSLGFIPPPGLLYQIDRHSPTHVLSVAHPLLVDVASQNQFARKVAGGLGLPLKTTLNVTSDRDLYRGAALVISSRLHGTVLALGNGIPCFTLSRDHKIDWFCNASGSIYISPQGHNLSDLCDRDVGMALETVAIDVQCLKSKLRVYLRELRESLKNHPEHGGQLCSHKD